MNKLASVISFVVTCALSTLATRGTSAQELSIQLVQPHERMPRYILSNLRLERDRNGKRVIKCDIRRTNDHKHHAEIRLRIGSARELERPLVSFNHNADSGTVQVRPDQAISDEIDRSGMEMLFAIELLSSRRGPSGNEDRRVQFKISNSVTLGLAKEAVTTRPPNKFETQRIEAWLEFVDRPPEQAPEPGMEMLKTNSQVTAGLPVKYKDLQGVWRDAEVIDVEGSWVYLLPSDERINDQLTATFCTKLAARTSDLQRAKANPSSWQASVMRPKGTSAYLPLDWTKVSNDILVPGTPIKYAEGKRLRSGVIKDDEILPPTRQALVFDRNAPTRRKILYRSTLKVRERTIPTEHIYVSGEILKALKATDARQRFAPFASEEAVLAGRNLFEKEDPPYNDTRSTSSTEASLNHPALTTKTASASSTTPTTAATTPTRKLKRYPITIPLPKGAVPLSPTAPLVQGVKLSACYTNKWYFVTVIEAHEDGSIRCNWDDWKSFTYDMSREDLIISTDTLVQLELRQQLKQPTERVWTDETGNFRVRATYVDSKQGYVQLQKPDGELISVLVRKLCLSDQRLIQKLAKAKR